MKIESRNNDNINFGQHVFVSYLYTGHLSMTHFDHMRTQIFEMQLNKLMTKFDLFLLCTFSARAFGLRQ